MVLRYANTLVWVCVHARCILERSLLSGESDERFSVHFIVTVLCRVCVCEREREVFRLAVLVAQGLCPGQSVW